MRLPLAVVTIKALESLLVGNPFSKRYAQALFAHDSGFVPSLLQKRANGLGTRFQWTLTLQVRIVGHGFEIPNIAAVAPFVVASDLGMARVQAC